MGKAQERARDHGRGESQLADRGRREGGGAKEAEGGDERERTDGGGGRARTEATRHTVHVLTTRGERRDREQQSTPPRQLDSAPELLGRDTVRSERARQMERERKGG